MHYTFTRAFVTNFYLFFYLFSNGSLNCESECQLNPSSHGSLCILSIHSHLTKSIIRKANIFTNVLQMFRETSRLL